MLVCSRTALSPIVDIRDLSSVSAPPYCLFSHAKGEGRQKRGTTKSTVLCKGRSTLTRCQRIGGTSGCQQHAAAAVAASAYTDVGASHQHLVGTRRTGDCIICNAGERGEMNFPRFCLNPETETDVARVILRDTAFQTLGRCNHRWLYTTKPQLVRRVDKDWQNQQEKVLKDKPRPNCSVKIHKKFKMHTTHTILRLCIRL